MVQLSAHIQMEKLKRIGSQLLLEVFIKALTQRTMAIIVAHNHTSGVLELSVEDRGDQTVEESLRYSRHPDHSRIRT